MPKQCDACGLQNPDASTACWSCMSPLLDPVLGFEAPSVAEPFVARSRLFDTSEVDTPPLIDAPPLAPMLDACAGLGWLCDTGSICVAVALLLDKKSRGPLLYVSTNIGAVLELPLTESVGLSDVAPRVDKKQARYFEMCKAATSVREVKTVTTRENRDEARAMTSALVCDRDVRFVEGPYMHAEMRLLEQVFLRQLQPAGPLLYIGISAVCCDNCYRAISAFNYAMQVTDKSGAPVQVTVFGHHPMRYPPSHWPMPAFLCPDQVGGYQQMFAEVAMERFWALVPGGRHAFMARGDPERDEDLHARPMWESTDDGFRKGS